MTRLWIGVCALGALMISVGCGASLPISGGPTAPITEANAWRPDQVRVMSFNIRTRTFIDAGNHWNHRKELLIETVNRFNPDVLGTQECTRSQAEYLRLKLPGYEFVGAGRNNGKTGGEMCAIFYKATMFRKLDEGHFWLSDEPSKPGSKGWGAAFPRMVSWVKLQPIRGGRDFYFFNTHFSAFNSGARIESAKFLRQEIDSISRGAPVVLAGDFNADTDSEPYRLLTESPRHRWSVALLDTMRAINPFGRESDGTRHGFDGKSESGRIDWILASPQFQTLHAGIDRSRRGGRYPSDHFPVTAVLKWRAGYAMHNPSYRGG